jgi:hypothetical protein
MVNVTFTGGRDGYRVHRRRAMSTQDKTCVTEVMLKMKKFDVAALERA